jgi:hypothetical protein
VHDFAAAHVDGMQNHVELERRAVRALKLPIEAFDASVEDPLSSLGKDLRRWPTVCLSRRREGM